ncbi:hypothetical protein B566_EDAN006512 [Ephemera danica]|nr:hypothetical protein B566_EDAN006512 [Ephemera danica]
MPGDVIGAMSSEEVSGGLEDATSSPTVKPPQTSAPVVASALPSVHGRPAAQGARAAGGRNLSSHQRNLSLDFRPMKITLPPVAQVTGGTTVAVLSATQHHRHRSLDLDLHRIPEVDVTPSPEVEKQQGTKLPPSTKPGGKPTREDLASLGSDDSGICGSETSTGTDRLKGSEETLALDETKSVQSDPEPEGSTAAEEEEDEGEEEDSAEEAETPLFEAPSQDTDEHTPCLDEQTKNCVAPPAVEAKPQLASTVAAGSGSGGPKKDNLLRLLESNMFQAPLAISYLFTTKEIGVQTYIANKLFMFPESEVDFYLPQLISMYIHIPELAALIFPYIKHRCIRSAEFSLRVVWLLEAYSSDAHLTSKKKSDGTKLKTQILSDKLRPRETRPHEPKPRPLTLLPSPSKKAHQRSQSDASAVLLGPPKTQAAADTSILSPEGSSGNGSSCLGDLRSGRAFNTGCTCFETHRGMVNELRGRKTSCICNAPRLEGELHFVRALLAIGHLLPTIPGGKEAQAIRLRAELDQINLNLPARVWLPIHSSSIPHHVLHINTAYSSVLNSKDKVLEVEDMATSPVPHKQIASLRSTKSEENLLANERPPSALSAASLQQAGSCYMPHSSSTGALAIYDDNSDCWTPEDDEISQQVICIAEPPSLRPRHHLSTVPGQQRLSGATSVCGSRGHQKETFLSVH